MPINSHLMRVSGQRARTGPDQGGVAERTKHASNASRASRSATKNVPAPAVSSVDCLTCAECWGMDRMPNRNPRWPGKRAYRSKGWSQQVGISPRTHLLIEATEEPIEKGLEKTY